MLSHQTLNSQSFQLIQNIWVNAKNHPMYSSYIVEKDILTYADAGAVAILLGNSRRTSQNTFLFYPASDGSGQIGSVAVYGTTLEGHKNAIEKSMLIFGLPVESVEWDHGKETFLDVTLKKY